VSGWKGHADTALEIMAADRFLIGLDFLLPLQRWRGYGGKSDPRGVCTETMTHTAALAGFTRRIALFTTAQTSILHPTWAARAVATIDHACRGRAGLNIVCGWNAHDFAMFNADDVGVEQRYDQAKSGPLFSPVKSGGSRHSTSAANIFRSKAPIPRRLRYSREVRRSSRLRFRYPAGPLLQNIVTSCSRLFRASTTPHVIPPRSRMKPQLTSTAFAS
jgi:hypothetical protein